MKTKILRKLGLDSIKHFKNEMFSGVLGFLSSIYIIPLTISLYKRANINSPGIFFILVISIFLINLIAAFTMKKPVIIGPSIAISILITKTLIINLGYSIGHVSSCLFMSSLILIVMNFKKIGIKIILKIPNYLKKYLGISMGLYLIYIGFFQGGFSVIKDGELSLGLFSSEKIWLFLFGCIIIFFCYFKRKNYGILLSILFLSIIIIIGIYLFDWKYPKLQSYKDFFSNNLISKKYATNLGNGFLKPGTYLFGFLISLLTIIGIPSMIHPINKSMVSGGFIEEEYSNNLYKTISFGSIFNFLGTSGYPSIFAETIIVTHSKGRSGFSTLVVSIMFLFTIFLYPIIPILSNTIVTSPLLVFIGFISVKSTISNMDKKINSELFIGLFVIITTVFTNSIPHGLTVAFTLNIFMHFKKRKEYINFYTLLLAFFMIVYEIIIFIVQNNIL